jgi:DNA-binding phage protein
MLTQSILYAYNLGTMDNHQIWQRVDELMRAKNIDMPTLADKSGISRQSLYNLKRKGSANTQTIQAIAAALEVGSGYLMG